MRTDVEKVLELAGLGFRVMPFCIIDGGKQPASKRVLALRCAAHQRGATPDEVVDCNDCRGGHHGATTNEREIRRMWKARPNFLVGVIAPAGTIALDDDSHTWDMLWSHLPHVRSQSGKSHYWFNLTSDQTELVTSENGVLYDGENPIDLRVSDGSRWIGIPCGRPEYQAMNGWTPDPATWPPLPDEVYERLLEAPRKSGGGLGSGGQGGHGSAGIEGMGIRGSDFGALEAMQDLLEQEGWQHDREDHWTRPGKESGTSGRFLEQDDDLWFFYCFTDNAEPLKADHWYTASMLRCVLVDGGECDPLSEARDDFEDDVVDNDWDLLGDLPKEVVVAVEAEGKVSCLLARAGEHSWAEKRPIIPGPDNPSEVALFLLRKLWGADKTGGGDVLLRHWQGGTYEWTGRHYEVIGDAQLEAVLVRLLKHCRWRKPRRSAGFDEVAWSPNPRSVRSVAQMIRLHVMLWDRVEAGDWLDGRSAERAISMQNGMLGLTSRELVQHSPSMFNTWSLSFDWLGPDARCPRWERSLQEWFPGDKDAQDHLEEVIAYLVLGGVTLDKIFIWLGASRAGKGTVARLIGKMMGAGFAPMALDELADRFGLEDLIGVRVCHITEAASTRDTRKVVSLMKSISGRDYVGSKIKRKGEKSQQAVTIDAAFLLTGNENVTLTDDSGAIGGRLDALSWNVSFLGREDPNLEAELEADLPGIFARVLVAWERLVARGRLVQPDSGKDLIAQLVAKAAPERTWLSETVEVTGDSRHTISVRSMANLYMEEVDHRLTEKAAQMKVSELLGQTVQTKRVRVASGGQERVYIGVRLWRESWEAALDEAKANGDLDEVRRLSELLEG